MEVRVCRLGWYIVALRVADSLPTGFVIWEFGDRPAINLFSSWHSVAAAASLPPPTGMPSVTSGLHSFRGTYYMITSCIVLRASESRDPYVPM